MTSEERDPASSDAELARRAAGGDAAALETLIARHYRLLYRAAFRLCGHREDAEDIAHEACIRVARNVGTFRGDSAFTTWLYRIVLNCAKDWRRSHRPTYDIDDVPEETVSGGQEEQEALRRLMRLLDALPEGVREAVWLVHGEGLTHGEAAAILGCAETTVSWRIFKARRAVEGRA